MTTVISLNIWNMSAVYWQMSISKLCFAFHAKLVLSKYIQMYIKLFLVQNKNKNTRVGFLRTYITWVKHYHHMSAEQRLLDLLLYCHVWRQCSSKFKLHLLIIIFHFRDLRKRLVLTLNSTTLKTHPGCTLMISVTTAFWPLTVTGMAAQKTSCSVKIAVLKVIV